MKVSATPPWGREPHPDPRVAPLMRRGYETFGAQRLLWSCAFPRLRGAEYVRGVELMESTTPFMSDADRAQVVGGTAMTLSRFGPF